MKSFTAATVLFAALAAPGFARADIIIQPSTTRSSAASTDSTSTGTTGTAKHHTKRHTAKSSAATKHRRHRKSSTAS